MFLAMIFNEIKCRVNTSLGLVRGDASPASSLCPRLAGWCLSAKTCSSNCLSFHKKMLVRKLRGSKQCQKLSSKVFQVWRQIVRHWLVDVRQWIWLEVLFQIIISLQVQQFQLYIIGSWINFCSEWRAEDIKLRFQVLKVLEPSVEFDSQGIQLNFILCCKFTRSVVTKSVVTSLPGEKWQLHL